MKLLAVDYGAKRIGLALGDSEGGIVVPFKVIQNGKNTLEEIKNLVREKRIDRIIVGLPLTMRGKEGQRAKEVRGFVEKLKEHISNVDVVLFDERFSTQEALRRLETYSPAKAKRLKDMYSAAVILEDYLQSGNGNLVLE